jgi:uncharacterized protein YndB with AHSA1/START domain
MRWASLTVAAPASTVWEVLADFGGLARWAPVVSHSRLITTGAVGVGSVRRVQIHRQALLEEIVDWNPPHRLGYRIRGLPIVRDAVTTWEVADSAGGCELRVGTRVLGPLPVSRLVARVLDRADRQMLRALAGFVTTSGAGT